jgi:hypothetical protein
VVPGGAIEGLAFEGLYKGLCLRGRSLCSLGSCVVCAGGHELVEMSMQFWEKLAFRAATVYMALGGVLVLVAVVVVVLKWLGL